MLMIHAYLQGFSDAVIYTSVHIALVWCLYRVLRFVCFRWLVRRPLLPIAFSQVALAWVFIVWCVNLYKVFAGAEVLPSVVSSYASSLSSASFSSAWEFDGSDIVPVAILLYYVAFFIYGLLPFRQEIKVLSSIYSLSRQQSQSPQAHVPRWFEKSLHSVSGLWKRKTQPLVVFITEKVGPLTMSVFKPIIVYPLAALNNLSPEETTTILAHEINHIQYADFYVNILLRIAKLLLPFNPFITQWISEIQFWQEVNCDKNVLQFYPRHTYASALVKVAEYQQVAIAQNAQSSLMLRMKYMYEEYPKNRLLGVRSMLGSFKTSSIAFYAVLVVGFFTFHLDPHSEVTPRKDNTNEHIAIAVPKKKASPTRKSHTAKRSEDQSIHPKASATIHTQTTSLPSQPTADITELKGQLEAWERFSAQLGRLHSVDMMPVSASALREEERSALKNFILESSVWMLSHQYFVPELLDVQSMTPEEFAAAFESYDEHNTFIREKVKQQLEQNNNLASLQQFASEVKDKILYLLYVEEMQQTIENGELQ